VAVEDALRFALVGRRHWLGSQRFVSR
jgi:hypothetical protein